MRKSAAPRAVMKPDELPPTPSPPPSERCIRMTPTSEIGDERLDDQQEGEHSDGLLCEMDGMRRSAAI